MVKKIRREDESERATREPQGRSSEEVADVPSGTEDEKVEERPDPDESVPEKKTASPGPSGA